MENGSHTLLFDSTAAQVEATKIFVGVKNGKQPDGAI
jgi:hypothetical protein